MTNAAKPRVPERAFVMLAKFDADTREDLAQLLSDFARRVRNEGFIGRSIGGGSTRGHIVELRVDETMTSDKYFAQLEAILDAPGESITSWP